MKKTLVLLFLGLIQISGFAQNSALNTPAFSLAQNSQWNGRFIKIPSVAQDGDGDWSGAIGMSRGVALAEALAIARNNPAITFFFYTNAAQMVLGNPNYRYRVFHQGDAVFFSGRPQWGDAGELADGYVKN